MSEEDEVMLDVFAAFAMLGVILNGDVRRPTEIAEVAYAHADAMMKERKKACARS